MSAPKPLVTKLKSTINKGKDYHLYKFEFHTVTTVLKLWFSELLEPVIPFDKYDEFIHIGKTPNSPSFDQILKSFINNLPHENKVSS